MERASFVPASHLQRTALPSVFLARGESNPLYHATLGICTALSAVTLLADLRLTFARAGGNRFAIESASQDQQQIASHLTLSRTSIKAGRYHTLLTSLFNHADFAHYAGNMWGLHNSGRTLRSVPFLIVFYGGGIVGNLLCLALDAQTNISIGMNESRRKVRAAGFYLGASGGVAALMAFMSCCFPNAAVTLYTPVPFTLPFWVHTIGFATYCSWAQKFGYDKSLAHLGHLGGIVWGITYFVTNFRRI